ncbi:hypothetical protein BGW41_001150, partial [Actinomortierella wolfii]
MSSLTELVKATATKTTSEEQRAQAAKVAEHVMSVGIVKTFGEGDFVKQITTLLDSKKIAHN